MGARATTEKLKIEISRRIFSKSVVEGHDDWNNEPEVTKFSKIISSKRIELLLINDLMEQFIINNDIKHELRKIIPSIETIIVSHYCFDMIKASISAEDYENILLPLIKLFEDNKIEPGLENARKIMTARAYCKNELNLISSQPACSFFNIGNSDHIYDHIISYVINTKTDNVSKIREAFDIRNKTSGDKKSFSAKYLEEISSQSVSK